MFKLKDDKIEEPDVYLGAQLDKMIVDEAPECWTMSAEKYVNASVKNVEEVLEKKGLRLPGKCWTPLPSDYRPELETSGKLKKDGVQTYQELIGVLRWAVELGRVVILLKVSLMATYMAMPREGATSSDAISHVQILEAAHKEEASFRSSASDDQ